MKTDQHIDTFAPVAAPDGPDDAPVMIDDEVVPYYGEASRDSERRPPSGYGEIDVLVSIERLEIHDLSLIGLYFVVRSMFAERGLGFHEMLEFNLGDLKAFSSHKTGLSRKLKHLQDLGLIDYRPARGKGKSLVRLIPCRTDKAN